MRHHFVFLNLCGCPFGLVEEHGDIRTPEAAWKFMYDGTSKKEIARELDAYRRGVQIKRVDHDVYCREYFPKMLGDWKCPHRTGAVQLELTDQVAS